LWRICHSKSKPPRGNAHEGLRCGALRPRCAQLSERAFLANRQLWHGFGFGRRDKQDE